VLGRGGRSGVGVATFEAGRFVVDAGHPAERFTTEPPTEGSWTVPPVVARHDLPGDWRFLVVLPDAEPGRSGDLEDESMRTVVERADPGIADHLAQLLVRRVLPAAAEGDWRGFGAAVAAFGRRNGAWYADTQGGVYRPPAGPIVERLGDCPVVAGAGQSSWGPAVYGVTDAAHVDEARTAAEDALAAAGSGGEVLVTEPRNVGATVEE
jgi:beta-ribofuranosylaminobenzene 5'-phosphate synthase